SDVCSSDLSKGITSKPHSVARACALDNVLLVIKTPVFKLEARFLHTSFPISPTPQIKIRGSTISVVKESTISVAAKDTEAAPSLKVVSCTTFLFVKNIVCNKRCKNGPARSSSAVYW